MSSGFRAFGATWKVLAVILTDILRAQGMMELFAEGFGKDSWIREREVENFREGKLI